MAANVTMLMSLIVQALGSGIIFFSGPQDVSIYLQNSTNISIYDVNQLSPTEEKALGNNNIFLDFNQQSGGKLDRKLMQLAGEHDLARIFKAHQGICDHEMFKTVLQSSNSIISNQNETHVVFHICQFNATTFLLNVLGGQDRIQIDESAVDNCRRPIGYKTTSTYLEPSVANMKELTHGKLCITERYCIYTKEKDHKTSNTLILNSPNCYDICKNECPKGEYMHHCGCHPETYDLVLHLVSTSNHPSGVFFFWLPMASALILFCVVYFRGVAYKIKYLHTLLLLVMSFFTATWFMLLATLDEEESKTGFCSAYVAWLHLFAPNIPVNRMLNCYYDKIPSKRRNALVLASLTISGVFIIWQQVSLDQEDSICFGLVFAPTRLTEGTRLLGYHLGLVYLCSLTCHCYYSNGNRLLFNNIVAVISDMLRFVFLNIIFKSLNSGRYSRDSLEILLRASDLVIEMGQAMVADYRKRKDNRLRMATVLLVPKAPIEANQEPKTTIDVSKGPEAATNLVLHRRITCRILSDPLNGPRSSMNKANSI